VSAAPIARLDGQVALVTGAGSGIGRAVAARLASDGAEVVVTDLDGAAAEKVAGAVTANGGRATALAMDVTDFAAVRRAFAAARDSAGPVDILVNCAGWDRMEPFLENHPDFWSKVIDINYRGHIHCCRAALDHMVERKRGKIVSISSDAARVGSTGEAVYSGCKGAIISFSKALAREVARYQVNVNVVCPGPTDTPLWWGMIEGKAEKLSESLLRAIPFRRLAQPDEIAAAVAFFASPDADYITGQVLSVSGGMTMAG
jgi:2-hydroxycyclohexanecarboxyl-CoA dehydrogenase